MTPESLAALERLRSPDHFQWYVVTLLAFVVYAYVEAARRGEWDKVTLSLAFWAGEFIWEMVNALVLHFSGWSALWTTPGDSAYVIYVGLNIEIAFMFAVAPLALLSLLPAERDAKILGIGNRVFIPLAFGLFCVAVESLLNAWGALVWSWPYWRWPHVEFIVVAYCLPFLLLAWLHDRWNLRARVVAFVVTVSAAVACHLVLGVSLGWI